MKEFPCDKCGRSFAKKEALVDHKRDKHEPNKAESMTFFELQEAAWYANDCQGHIEEYDGNEF